MHLCAQTKNLFMQNTKLVDIHDRVKLQELAHRYFDANCELFYGDFTNQRQGRLS